MTEVSIYGLLAVGMTLVILTAGIDLSVGSLLAFCGMCAAYVAKGGAGFDSSGSAGFPWFVALLVSLVVGAMAGGIHGLAITN